MFAQELARTHFITKLLYKLNYSEYQHSVPDELNDLLFVNNLIVIGNFTEHLCYNIYTCIHVFVKYLRYSFIQFFDIKTKPIFGHKNVCLFKINI